MSVSLIEGKSSTSCGCATQVAFGNLCHPDETEIDDFHVMWLPELINGVFSFEVVRFIESRRFVGWHRMPFRRLRV